MDKDVLPDHHSVYRCTHTRSQVNSGCEMNFNGLPVTSCACLFVCVSLASCCKLATLQLWLFELQIIWDVSLFLTPVQIGLRNCLWLCWCVFRLVRQSRGEWLSFFFLCSVITLQVWRSRTLWHLCLHRTALPGLLPFSSGFLCHLCALLIGWEGMEIIQDLGRYQLLSNHSSLPLLSFSH